MDILRKYHWYGNVRELENVILGCCVRAEGPEIGPLHLPDGVLNSVMISGSLGTGKPRPLDEVCAKYTKTVLAHVGFNKKSACRFLGIYYPRLKKYRDLID
jgi:DNA-binding NtrC family response regulator